MRDLQFGLPAAAFCRPGAVRAESEMGKWLIWEIRQPKVADSRETTP
jgi:hypothetical protein